MAMWILLPPSQSSRSGRAVDRERLVPLVACGAALTAARLAWAMERAKRAPRPGEAHLRRTLAAYAAYYNGLRTHLALKKDAPLWRPTQWVGRILPMPILGSLHHQYVRMA
jgi:hypothetical protein